MSRRIIMQEVNTCLYLAPNGSWTANCQAAKTYEHTYQALLEGMRYGDKVLQVVWCFRNPSMNLYMNVRPGLEGLTHACLECPLAQAA
ncbi:MAG TPA: hypothetical protein VL361_06035 [Candidatus Limnocylindrales bacterium]|jgi:hypothetical protein|nr:hypothetical protein [Candidatus Limnocylindrales bacterium]